MFFVFNNIQGLVCFKTAARKNGRLGYRRCCSSHSLATPISASRAISICLTNAGVWLLGRQDSPDRLAHRAGGPSKPPHPLEHGRRPALLETVHAGLRLARRAAAAGDFGIAAAHFDSQGWGLGADMAALPASHHPSRIAYNCQDGRLSERTGRKEKTSPPPRHRGTERVRKTSGLPALRTKVKMRRRILG